MGGEGGGVLADWIVDLAENSGYLAQSTSVPGVAQRTGATIYYVEIFPESAAKSEGKAPVLALMPIPGDVDIVLASELMEAGRAITRGIVTSDRTTMITSTHRVYTIGEKSAMGNGIIDGSRFIEAGQAAAKRFIYTDMAKIAEDTGSVISAVLFGALAGAGVLPFHRKDFEEAVRRGGVGVQASLKAFAVGYAQAENPAVATIAKAIVPAPAPMPKTGHAALDALRTRVDALPEALRTIAAEGVKRMLDYQDVAYANQYLDRLQPVVEIDQRHGDGTSQLGIETARYLALWMSYEDTIRVADLKTRSARFHRVGVEVHAKSEQVLRIKEFMHPRIEEICDTLPAWLGRWIMQSNGLRSFLGKFTTKGRIIQTTSLSGFLLLYVVAGMRRWRRITLRYQVEDANIIIWLDRVRALAAGDYALAVEVAECQRLVKGYGETHERGSHNFRAIMGVLEQLRGKGDAARHVRELREAALADEQGARFNEVLKLCLAN